jgi:hypothetical protein
MNSSLMGRVIRFRGGRHREVADLLPWHLSGRLDADESERVQAHLSVCAECQAEVGFQQRLGEEIAELPLDVEQGWAQMLRRIEADGAPRARVRREAPAWRPRQFGGAVTLAWRASPTWGGWALAGSLLIAAFLWLPPLSGTPDYRALSAGTVAAPADIVVVFRPETPERDLRAALRASHARLVGGPTEADAYLLSAPLAERPQALALLRSRPDVVLAQPLDPEPAR